MMERATYAICHEYNVHRNSQKYYKETNSKNEVQNLEQKYLDVLIGYAKEMKKSLFQHEQQDWLVEDRS